MSKPTVVSCIDCKAAGITKPRVIFLVNGKPSPGKRCREHYYARREVVRAKNRKRSLESLYEMSPEEFAELFEFQGRQCFICERAKGKTRNLHVDHDHAIKNRRRSIRGLLCNTCNRILIGRYDIAALRRAIEYRQSPPAQRFFRQKCRDNGGHDWEPQVPGQRNTCANCGYQGDIFEPELAGAT